MEGSEIERQWHLIREWRFRSTGEEGTAAAYMDNILTEMAFELPSPGDVFRKGNRCHGSVG